MTLLRVLWAASAFVVQPWEVYCHNDELLFILLLHTVIITCEGNAELKSLTRVAIDCLHSRAIVAWVPSDGYLKHDDNWTKLNQPHTGCPVSYTGAFTFIDLRGDPSPVDTSWFVVEIYGTLITIPRIKLCLGSPNRTSAMTCALWHCALDAFLIYRSLMASTLIASQLEVRTTWRRIPAYLSLSLVDLCTTRTVYFDCLPVSKSKLYTFAAVSSVCELQVTLRLSVTHACAGILLNGTKWLCETEYIISMYMETNH